MSDEVVNVSDGDLVVFDGGGETLSFGNFTYHGVAAVYEPTDLSDDSSLFNRWFHKNGALSLSNWLKQEVEAGRVRIFDQKYQAKPAVKEGIITIDGKKYKLTEVQE